MAPARRPGSSTRWKTRCGAPAIRVRRNKPYAGGFITEHYGAPAAARHVVQIEINRALYMDERAMVKSERWRELERELVRDGRALASRVADEIGRPQMAAE